MQPITNIRRLPQAESASGEDRVLVYCPERQRTVTAAATDYDPAGSAARAEARVRDTIRRTPDPLLMMMLS